MSKFMFMGTDGSMGYKHGKVYHGSVGLNVDGTVVFIPGIYPFNLLKKVIPYASMASFYRNWRPV